MGRAHHVVGLVESILIGTGILSIFASPAGSQYGNASVLSNLINIFKTVQGGGDASAGINQLPGQLQSSVMSFQWLPPVAMAIGIGIVSRIFKLRRHTMLTKKLAAV